MHCLWYLWHDISPEEDFHWCFSEGYWAESPIVIFSWRVEHWPFCANASSGGAGKAYVLLFALFWQAWPPCRQLWRDKVQFTMTLCSHQRRPRQGQTLLSGFLMCMLTLWEPVWELEAALNSLMISHRHNHWQPSELGQRFPSARVWKKVHHSKTTRTAECQVFSVGSACKGISCTVVALSLHSESLRRIWFFAGISPAESSNWDIPLAAVGHTTEYH